MLTFLSLCFLMCKMVCFLPKDLVRIKQNNACTIFSTVILFFIIIIIFFIFGQGAQHVES